MLLRQRRLRRAGWLLCSFYFPLVSVLLSVNPALAKDGSVQELVEATLEFEAPSSTSVVSSVAHTPIWSADGYLYDAWIDPEQRLMLMQKSKRGKVKTTAIMDGVRHDNHNGPSIAVDRKGYIHVVGDLHNGGATKAQWNYWVSEKPHDISSFTFRGGSVWDEPKTWLPSNMPTYPLFRPDNKDILYVTWRGRLVSSTATPGYRGIMMAVHDGKKPAPWKMLGVKHPEQKHWPATTIAWEPYSRPAPKGSNEAVNYQTLRGHTWFDRKNNLHMAWCVFGPGAQTPATEGNKNKVGSGATHLMYAMSKDGGKTWEDSKGKNLTLPIRLDEGGVVLQRNPGDLTTQVFLTVTKDGRPIISYTVGGLTLHGTHHMVIADKKGNWSEPKPLPADQWSTYRVVADRKGVLTLPGTKTWYRSHDDGETWTPYLNAPVYGGGGNGSIDYTYLRDTGEIRFHTFEKVDDKPMVRVWTVAFEKKK